MLSTEYGKTKYMILSDYCSFLIIQCYLMISMKLVVSSLLWLTLLQMGGWTRWFQEMPSDFNNSVILYLQCQTLHYDCKTVHLINSKKTYFFLLLCASRFPNVSPCSRECESAIPSHTNTKTDGPCSYLAINNDLGMIRSRTGIFLNTCVRMIIWANLKMTFHYLC